MDDGGRQTADGGRRQATTDKSDSYVSGLRSRVSRSRIFHLLPALLIGGLLLLNSIHMLAPQRTGWLALSQALAPLLFVPLLAVVPLALFVRRRLLWLLLGLAGLLFVGRFVLPLPWNPPVAPTSAGLFRVQLWNLKERQSAPQTERACQLLATSDADLIGLVEANPTQIQCEAAVMARYPHRHYSGSPSNGLLLVSRYPLAGPPAQDRPGTPTFTWASVQVGSIAPLIVLAHPPAPQIKLPGEDGCTQPLCYDTGARDAALAELGAFVRQHTGNRQPLLLMGDLNLTEREPGYADLTSQLRDLHRLVGQGPGLTWGLHPRLGILMPLLRLDYLLASAALQPQFIAYDCTFRGSDHCVVSSGFMIE